MATADAMNAALHPVESSLLRYVGHQGYTLRVIFHDGACWDYHGVTAEEHSRMLAAHSIGGHFLSHIKAKHAATKVWPLEPGKPGDGSQGSAGAIGSRSPT